MKTYMASPDWSENVTSFFSRGFPLAKEGKIFFSNFFSLLVLLFLFYQPGFGCLLCKNNCCNNSYNIQYPIWGKRDLSFWQEYSELFHVRWMVTTVLKAKIMNFPQINLNQMQKSVVSDRSHDIPFQISNYNHAWVDSDEKRGIKHYCVIFTARESYATVANILKIINLEELCTYLIWQESKRW